MPTCRFLSDGAGTHGRRRNLHRLFAFSADSKPSCTAQSSSRGLAAGGIPGRGASFALGWERKSERSPLPILAFNPDLTPMRLDDFLTDREADSCALVLLCSVKALENPKHLGMVLIGDTDPVVSYREHPAAFFLLASDMDVRRDALAPKFDRIPYEILK